MSEKYKILFVCMGNICRSPTAEGVFRQYAEEAGLSERLRIDSAGTHAYHVSEPPDRRSREAASRRGVSLDDIRARRVQIEDYATFDLVLAMDEENQRRMLEQADAEHHAKIKLFLEYGSSAEREVPDPYYGGASGFERVLDLIEDASKGLLKTILR